MAAADPDVILGPPGLPSHPLAAARFGLAAMQSAQRACRAALSHGSARGAVAGNAAHGMRPLDTLPSGAIGLVLAAVAHTHGWPIPRGGAQRLADALGSYLRSLGGEIVTGAADRGRSRTSRRRAPSSATSRRARSCDRRPGTAGPSIAASSCAPLRPGLFKVDYALDGPVPWSDRAVARRPPSTRRLARRHRAAERVAWEGEESERPFVLVSQPSLFDDTRAPAGRHTLWASCHVPHASPADMLPRIERQIERFAPGFRDRILARHVMTPQDLERRNPNLAGGDIGMGVTDLRQMLARPRGAGTARRAAAVPLLGSTPPGAGVHGMCGYWAARTVMKRVFRRRFPPSLEV